MMGIRPPPASPSFSPKSLVLCLHENSIAVKFRDGSAHRAIPIPPRWRHLSFLSPFSKASLLPTWKSVDGLTIGQSLSFPTEVFVIIRAA
jgi:hypothetical protein